jgi:hypothetical protein
VIRMNAADAPAARLTGTEPHEVARRTRRRRPGLDRNLRLGDIEPALPRAERASPSPGEAAGPGLEASSGAGQRTMHSLAFATAPALQRRGARQ